MYSFNNLSFNLFHATGLLIYSFQTSGMEWVNSLFYVFYFKWIIIFFFLVVDAFLSHIDSVLWVNPLLICLSLVTLASTIKSSLDILVELIHLVKPATFFPCFTLSTYKFFTWILGCDTHSPSYAEASSSLKNFDQILIASLSDFSFNSRGAAFFITWLLRFSMMSIRIKYPVRILLNFCVDSGWNCYIKPLSKVSSKASIIFIA